MADESSQRLPSFPWFVGCLALILLIVATGVRGQPDPPLLAGNDSAASIDVSKEDDALQADSDARFVTTIRRPSGPPVIELQQPDPQGRLGRVACSTCHSIRAPNLENRKPSDLNEFHQNMLMAHGELACYACHNTSDADTLRLADSTAVEYVRRDDIVCAVSRTQARDYKHGAHGGMTAAIGI